MIFDNELVKQLCNDYIHTHNDALLEQIHTSSRPLIEAVASTIDFDRDDLIQIGHLKLHKLLQDGVIDVDKGSLYSFLSRVLKNCMIDEVRAIKQYQELTDDMELYEYSEPMIADTEDVKSYAVDRFPSLHSSVVVDAAEYIMRSNAESVNGKSRGAVTTLDLFYPFGSRNLAYVFYMSVNTYVKSRLSGQKLWVDDALSMVCELEHTLIPEVALVVGLEITELLRLSLRGSYVKF